jgi:predicted enzyme related to lactoylglutathione lyase
MEIAYICIYASNFDESVTFYRDILGLEFDKNRSEESFCALKAGSTYIGIEPNGTRKNERKTKAENPILIQFKTKNIKELEEYTKYLESKGVRLFDRMMNSSYGTYTNFIDPDGNKLEILYQESSSIS